MRIYIVYMYYTCCLENSKMIGTCAEWIKENLPPSRQFQIESLFAELTIQDVVVLNEMVNDTVGICNVVSDRVLFTIDLMKYREEIVLNFEPFKLSKSGISIYFTLNLSPFLELLDMVGEETSASQYLLKEIIFTLSEVTTFHRKLPEKALKIPVCLHHLFPAVFAFESEVHDVVPNQVNGLPF
jgi:hypothetical protein